jgi:hypothetical protein
VSDDCRANEVLVYTYRFWDEDAQTYKGSGNLYATIMTIRNGLGIPNLDSAKWVPLSDVQDGIYIYRRPSEKREKA